MISSFDKLLERKERKNLLALIAISYSTACQVKVQNGVKK